MSTRPRTDRLLEMLAVFLLGTATVATAWCGFQAAVWSGNSDDYRLEATQTRIEASRLYSEATTAAAYDASIVARYADAYRSKDKGLMAFYRASLIRPDFLPVVDRWEAIARAGKTPPNLLEDKAYREALLQPFQEAEAKTAELDAASDAAGSTADSYVLMTVMLAMGLFFAGVTSSFQYRPAKLFLMAACVLVISIAATRIVSLPVDVSSIPLFANR